MEPQEIDIQLDELENRLDRLRSLYEQYFLGIEKIEPSIARKDVDRRFWMLRRTQIRNTARRFRLQVLVQRYNTFQQYWTRICREIEAGTYVRHLLKAQKTVGVEPKTWAAKKRLGLLRKGAAEEGEPGAAPEGGLESMLESGEDLARAGELAAMEALASAERAAVAKSPAPRAPTTIRLEELGPLDLDFDDDDEPAPPPRRGPPTVEARPAPDPAPMPSRGLGPAAALMMGGSGTAGARAHTAERPPAAETPPAPPASAPGRAALPPRSPSMPPASERGASPSAASGSLPPASRRVALPSRGDAPPVSQRPPLPPRQGPGAVSAAPSRAPAPPAPATGGPAGAGGRPAAPVASPAAAVQPRPAPAAAPGAARPSPATAPARPDPSPLPPAAQRPAPAVQRPQPGQPAARPAGAGVSDERLKQLHAELVETKRKLNQSDSVSMDSLAKSLRDTETRLRAQHQGKTIDFQVVVKDGKPVVKPVVRR